MPNNNLLANISYQNGLFMCKECPYSYKEAKMLREQAAKQHKKWQCEIFPQGQLVDPNLKTVHNCNICHISFADNSQLQQHTNSDHCGMDILNNRPLINCSYKDGLFCAKSVLTHLREHQ